MTIGIVLAAGSGVRLQKDLNLDAVGPKCLIKLNDHSLLERQIYDFKNAEFEKVVIVSGFKEELLYKEVKNLQEKYAIAIDIVKNEQFATTNTAFSLFLALVQIDKSDAIIINGDVIYNYNIFSDLVSMEKTAIVVDNTKKLNEESFKVTISHGNISSMGKQIPIEGSSGEFIGLSKICRDELSKSKTLLTQLIDENRMSYYDLIFKDLSTQIDIGYIFTNGKKWTEIDDIYDFRYAETISSAIDDTRLMNV